MATEIERKFVARVPDARSLGRGETIHQVYLRTGDPEVRVRRRGSRYTVTVKEGSGLERQEHEEEVGRELGEALLGASDVAVDKRRHEEGRWVIDVYRERFAGLVVAEVELESADEPLPDPPEGVGLGTELTEDPRFSNARLAELDEDAGAALVRELEGR